MANERLADAMRRAGHTNESLADVLGVAPKTVERWITKDRAPYARNRADAARKLGEDEAWLFPNATNAWRNEQAAKSELVQLYPRRSMLSPDDWIRLFTKAGAFIDVLVYAGLFLPEQLPNAVELIRAKAADGVRVRLLLGESNSAAVGVRSVEEGIGNAVASKVQNALSLLRGTLANCPDVAVRLHGTTLYTSIYRVDDEMIANPHVIGLPAAQAPALHLRRLAPAGLFDTYLAAYDRVWEDAKPAWT